MLSLSGFKKFFDSLYKKYKNLTIIIIWIVMSLFLQFILGTYNKYTSIVDSLQDLSILNKSRIISLESEFDTQMKTGVVTRKSFDAYIKRKDNEHHDQMAINNYFFGKIGYIEGFLFNNKGANKDNE